MDASDKKVVLRRFPTRATSIGVMVKTAHTNKPYYIQLLQLWVLYVYVYGKTKDRHGQMTNAKGLRSVDTNTKSTFCRSTKIRVVTCPRE